MARIAYFDCFSGIAGDMALGALVDAGAPPEALREALRGIGCGREFDLRFDRVHRGPLAALKARVTVLREDAPERHLMEVIGIIDGGDLEPAVAERARRTFERLAEAEAAVHGTTREEVHFHEVGAIDAIADVCGTAAALDLLGVEHVYSAEPVVGRGAIRSAHGELPAPGPAFLHLLAGVRAPVRTRDVPYELTTPTGAAILTTLAHAFGPAPDMALRSVGYGAGDRDPPEGLPNVLRVLVGETAAPGGPGAPESCVAIEANLDDASPQVVGHALERLLAAGALDAFVTPAGMKNSRPGLFLTVLARDSDVERLERAIFEETTTFGVRRHAVSRTVLERSFVGVTTRFGTVRMKVGKFRGEVLQATPEFEDCRGLAERAGVPVRSVIEAAARAYSGGTTSQATRSS